MTTSWLYVSNDTKTFSNDAFLPNLPVPPLHQTMEKYLESVKPLVTKEEFEETKQSVANFENGDGPELQKLLEERSKQKRNWLEQWWEDLAYLSNRAPLLPHLNMAGSFPKHDIYFGDLDSQRGITALNLHYVLIFWQLLRQENLRPHVSQNFTWSMNQFRRLFNTTRIPGEEIDRLASWFVPESEGPLGPTHIIIQCNGHFFMLDCFPNNEILLPQEFLVFLKYIETYCTTHPPGPGVGILTTTDRTTWAQNRKKLSSLDPRNASILRWIDTALFVLILEGYPIMEKSHNISKTMAGDLKNRWADKSLSFVNFSNDELGVSCDHAPFDGMVTMVLGHFITLSIAEGYSEWQDKPCRQLSDPKKLDFVLDSSLHTEIDRATVETKSRIDEIDVLNISFTDYGKESFRHLRLKPEAFLQLGIQLGYYKAHHKFAPTYVTATTRKYYHGRTETVRSCLPEVVEWVKAMEDSSIADDEKKDLFHKAITKLTKEMIAGLNNECCDRHLLGLYMIAQENNKPIPNIFFDPAFLKSGGNGNFVLSTSLMGYTRLYGCVMPMLENGYGVFYSILDTEFIFLISSFKTCPETDSQLLFSKLEDAFRQIKNLLLTDNSKL